ncbi:hypothetical protein GCM10011529_15430 [Polymorphobacter glacialis]|uniref:PEP-CTERM sorting domain-containing protein n=1 Tax=Sandarakinorhabdus glacialis TaxID=1614636 RepID=A0A916ZR20_9SPHN|nr:PEPxxWA-CTERM sorting domain-containing protein [Polymorphobacter glacialis]GGE10005.1 hypothetical protein GCM10011529_15430 [Polymorphobacter glacialis]
MKLKLLAAVAALAVSAPSLAVELVANGGFETGDIAPFTLSGYTGYSDVSTSAAHSGSFGYSNGAVGSQGFLSQTVATIAGATYNYSFWLSNSGSYSEFSATLGNTTFVSLIDPGNFGYTNFTGSVVADSSNATLTFGFRNDPDFYNFDDVSLTSMVPEPASWMLLIGGFAMTGAAMRRRKVALAA